MFARRSEGGCSEIAVVPSGRIALGKCHSVRTADPAKPFLHRVTDFVGLRYQSSYAVSKPVAAVGEWVRLLDCSGF